VDRNGTVLGSHDGVQAFTIGQRRGLGVATGSVRYVVDLDAPRATVTIGPYAELLAKDIAVRDLHFVNGSPDSRLLAIQTRAHGAPLSGRLEGHRVRLAAPAPRVACGQVVALYDGDQLLGGGLAA
jgi:tRNA-specific 2-thiouridylase